MSENKRIEVNTVFGTVSAEASGDPMYPGINICIDSVDEAGQKYERQLALVEATPKMPADDAYSLRLLVWNGDHDDYTDDFTFMEEYPGRNLDNGIITLDYKEFAMRIGLLDYNISLSFAVKHDEETGELEDWFGVTKIASFDGNCLLVGENGGGLWQAFDITANMDSELQLIESAAQAIFSWLGVDTIYVKEA